MRSFNKSPALNNLKLRSLSFYTNGHISGVIVVNSLVSNAQASLEKSFDIYYAKYAAFYMCDLIHRTIILSGKSPDAEHCGAWC